MPTVNPGPATTVSANQQGSLSVPVLALNSQALFEQALSGVTFNGTTDDSAALQSALNSFVQPARAMVRFPSGITCKLNSGITLTAGVHSIDFQGSILDFSGMTSGFAITVQDTGVVNSDNLMKSLPVISNLIMYGPGGSTTVDGINIAVQNPGTGQISGLTFRDITIGSKVSGVYKSFRDGLKVGAYCYINQFWNPNIQGCNRYGINYGPVTVAGENMSLHGGRIADCQNANNAIGIFMPNVDAGQGELMLFGVSLDYCDMLVDVESGVLTLHGCHMEGNNTANPMFTINWNSGSLPSGVFIDGGSITPTEAAPGRTNLVNMNSDARAFFKAKCRWSLFNLSTTLVNSTGGTADLSGSVIDYSSSSTNACLPGSVLNCLYNPGFELGALTGWYTTGTGYTSSIVASPVHSGSNAAQVVSASGNSGGLSNQTGTTPTLACKAGQTVIARGWVDITAISAGSVQLQLIFLAADGTTAVQTNNMNFPSLSLTSLTATTGGYVEGRGRFTAPQGACYAKYNLRGTTFTGTVLLDDTELYVV